MRSIMASLDVKKLGSLLVSIHIARKEIFSCSKIMKEVDQCSSVDGIHPRVGDACNLRVASQRSVQHATFILARKYFPFKKINM
jgi:hypothetical protein